jgi:DNA polymerase I
MFIKALNRNLNLQRFKVPHVSGNYSAILSRLDCRFEALEIRQGFTDFHLINILVEANHSLILVEHDPLLYEDARKMVEYVSHALSDAAKEAAVLLCASGLDPYFEDLVKNADRVFYIEDGPRETPRMVAKAHQWVRGAQTSLEERSWDQL